jgi:phosphatidylserine decarboxylase
MRPTSNNNPFAYVDRRTGALRSDPIYAAAFLDWCHNTAPGNSLAHALLSRRFVSRLYGWYCRQPWTRFRIASFARAVGADLTELAQPLASFRSLGDFMTREIDLSRRPIDPDPHTCVCPADGRVLAYPVVHADTSLRIKSGLFDLTALLRDESLSRRYAGGACAIVRLYLGDYHHFHFPDSGIPSEPRVLAGRYFAVTPYARRWAAPFYGENHRVITMLDSDDFGPIAMIEIGAFAVGSVREGFVPHRRVAKGDHKGFFAPGGSVVVLLFEPGSIRLDDDLCENTCAGVETFVRMGESIGRQEGGLSAA